MAGKFTKCPQCGGKKPQLMACVECGYSYIQRKLKNRSIVNNRHRSYTSSKSIDDTVPIGSSVKMKKYKTDMKFITNTEIADYLSRNPSIESMGKFGVPQDRYRYGFYGSKSMTYDVWGRNP